MPKWATVRSNMNRATTRQPRIVLNLLLFCIICKHYTFVSFSIVYVSVYSQSSSLYHVLYTCNRIDEKIFSVLCIDLCVCISSSQRISMNISYWKLIKYSDQFVSFFVVLSVSATFLQHKFVTLLTNKVVNQILFIHACSP